MDYFSELLKSKITNESFDFHPGCKEIVLVNISFDDDLFIMCGPSTRFMKLIKEVLEEFGEYLGLKPNLAKSSCYFAGNFK
ncbi:hypothetical protein LIER_32477 [Lithospermum erythrorhizon]|uniref:Reverse transcriptase n=1 Tax=Lithospermum erythrorhizon TaxID=34254 RepID=A0AAV3RW56_LITER